MFSVEEKPVCMMKVGNLLQMGEIYVTVWKNIVQAVIFPAPSVSQKSVEQNVGQTGVGYIKKLKLKDQTGKLHFPMHLGPSTTEIKS